MLTTSKTRQRMGPVFIAVGITLALWLVSKWYYQDWFVNPYKYIAKTASLSATVLMGCCVVLSTRWRFVERFFGGLDKVYQDYSLRPRLRRPPPILTFLIFLNANGLGDASVLSSGTGCGQG